LSQSENTASPHSQEEEKERAWLIKWSVSKQTSQTINKNENPRGYRLGTVNGKTKVNVTTKGQQYIHVCVVHCVCVVHLFALCILYNQNSEMNFQKLHLFEMRLVFVSIVYLWFISFQNFCEKKRFAHDFYYFYQGQLYMWEFKTERLSYLKQSWQTFSHKDIFLV
jgi:hypothetical protein